MELAIHLGQVKYADCEILSWAIEDESLHLLLLYLITTRINHSLFFI